MGTRLPGVPSDESTEESLLPVCDRWRVPIYLVCDPHEWYEEILWQRAEGRKHCSTFSNLQKWGYRPEARGYHGRWSVSWRVETTHSGGYEIEWQSPTANQMLESRHQQKNAMVEGATSLCGASHLHPSALLQQQYATKMPLYWNVHCALVVGDTGKDRSVKTIRC